jgi:hypothetical protein
MSASLPSEFGNAPDELGDFVFGKFSYRTNGGERLIVPEPETTKDIETAI